MQNDADQKNHKESSNVVSVNPAKQSNPDDSQRQESSYPHDNGY